ncbi:hypothetical protein PINS_up020841 [Pythium insidiosum]|nr:hypothetical protein PINS_up003908 [Pythium insidiosum]GLE09238.1 hypothetical protein PINS_up020841 [Pythium insidiosum]
MDENEKTREAIPKASERLAAKQKQKEQIALEEWAAHERERNVLVEEYLSAYMEKAIADAHLRKVLKNEGSKSAAADDVRLITDLRYELAVSTKRRLFC